MRLSTKKRLYFKIKAPAGTRLVAQGLFSQRNVLFQEKTCGHEIGRTRLVSTKQRLYFTRKKSLRARDWSHKACFYGNTFISNKKTLRLPISRPKLVFTEKRYVWQLFVTTDFPAMKLAETFSSHTVASRRI